MISNNMYIYSKIIFVSVLYNNYYIIIQYIYIYIYIYVLFNYVYTRRLYIIYDKLYLDLHT